MRNADDRAPEADRIAEGVPRADRANEHTECDRASSTHVKIRGRKSSPRVSALGADDKLAASFAVWQEAWRIHRQPQSEDRDKPQFRGIARWHAAEKAYRRCGPRSS